MQVGSTVYTLPSGGSSSSGVTSVTTSGSGNAVTSASISGNTLTLTKGSTFLTAHQSLASCAKLSANNTFTGINIFHKEETATSGDKTISEAKIDPGPTAPLILLEKKTVASDGFTVTGDATIRPDSIVLSNNGTGYTTSITYDGFTADSSGVYTKYYTGNIVHNTASSGAE